MILLSWELGTSFGHILPMKIISNFLKEKGYQTTFAIPYKDKKLDYLYEDENVICLEYEVRKDKIESHVSHLCTTYIDTLSSIGYPDKDLLKRNILKAIHLLIYNNIRYVIGDSSPIFAIAAYCLEIPFLHIGTGFLVPSGYKDKFTHHLKLRPNLNPFEFIKESYHNLYSQLQFKNTIKFILSELNIDTSISIYDLLFKNNLVFTYPEIDHYPTNNPNRNYTKALSYTKLNKDIEKVDWMNTGKKKILCYLHSDNQLTLFLIKALQKIDAEIICLSPGLNDRTTEKNNKNGLITINRFVDFNHLLKDADLCISHAGHNTIIECIDNDVPMLNIPLHIEQSITAKNIKDNKLGNTYFQFLPDVNVIIRSINSTLSNLDTYKTNLKSISSKYKSWKEEDTLSKILEFITIH